MPTYDKIIVGSVKVIKGKSKQFDPFVSPMKVYEKPNWEFHITDEKGKEYDSLTFHDKRWYEYYNSRIKKGNLLFVCYDSYQTARIRIFQDGKDWTKHLKETIAWCEKEIGQLAERQKVVEAKLADYRTQL